MKHSLGTINTRCCGGRGWGLPEQLLKQMCQFYQFSLKILGITLIFLLHQNDLIFSDREAFRVLPFGNKLFYWLFLKTRLPLRPVFGGFPVKLRTHIGEPIYPEPDMTPEMMRDKCKVSC